MAFTIANARSLDGLMKWLTREEWKNEFEEVFDRHLMPACDNAGIEGDEAVSILGRDWFMTTVWGCAFEDFLTHESAAGRNIVDDYLKRRGWKESAAARAYMSALRHSVISLYEVSNIVPDTSFLARDMVRGGEPFLISERSATRSLKPWDRIAARVIPLGSQIIIAGGVLPFSQEASEELLKLLGRTSKRALKERHKLADLVAGNPDDPRIINAFSDPVLLHVAAPIVTTVWLNDILDRSVNPRIPDVRNTEGDELTFCTVHFPLSETALPKDIRSALHKLPELRQETESFWNWLSARDPPRRKQAKKNTETQRFQTFSTTLDDGSLVLGNIELKDRSLVLSVNSQARAERGRALLASNLGALVGKPLVEMQTLDQVMASRSSAPAPPPSLPELTPEQRRIIIHDSLDKQYRKMLNEPIPMLGNMSPRKAVKNEKGRVKVVDWLKTLENHSAKSGGPSDPMTTYDFTWLWIALGVADLRK